MRTLIRTRWLKAGALVAVAAVVLRPALRLGYSPDDVDVLQLLRWRPMLELLGQCAMPIYFRPLCMPVFIVFYRLFGAWLLPLRCAILGLHLSAALFLGLLALEISECEAVGLLAGFLYSIGPTHWDLFVFIRNFGQAAAHALLWAALWICCRRRPRVAVATLMAATALFFKEDAIVFAPLAIAARGAQGRPLSRGETIATLIPGCAYLVLRLGLSIWLPLSELIVQARLPRPGLVPEALEALIGSLASPMRSAGAIDGEPFRIIGILCALASVILYRALVARRRARLAQTAAFGVFSFIIGLAPYAPFNALAYSDPHRWALTWAGLAIALSAAASIPRQSWAALAVSLWMGWFALGTAVTLRHPNRRRLLFACLRMTDELNRALNGASANLFPRLHDHDVVVVQGFAPLANVPIGLKALSPVKIRTLEMPEAGLRGWRFTARADGGALAEEIK